MKLLAGIAQFLFGKNESNKNQTQAAMVEPLENRQFLSVSMFGAAPCDCDSPILEAALPATSPAIGKWKGTVQTNLRPRPFKAMINIQSVTATGKIDGVASIPFLVDNYKFDINTRKSTMKPDGSFVVRVNKFGVSATFKGHYDDVSKHVVGDFNATAPSRTVTGTFDFARL